MENVDIVSNRLKVLRMFFLLYEKLLTDSLRESGTFNSNSENTTSQGDALLVLIVKDDKYIKKYLPNLSCSYDYMNHMYNYPNYFIGAIEENVPTVKAQLINRVKIQLLVAITKAEVDEAENNSKVDQKNYDWPQDAKMQGKKFSFNDNNEIVFSGHRFGLFKELFDSTGKPVLLSSLSKSSKAGDPARTLDQMAIRLKEKCPDVRLVSETDNDDMATRRLNFTPHK